jgi:hypothetical protein
MFASIGISLEWKTTEPPAESSQLPIIMELAYGPENLMPRTLAYARPYEGSHITVFLDRIERMEYPAFVLAHVMVHEITHIVQGIDRHSNTGVMKAHWSGQDHYEMRHRPLPFSEEDVVLIYRGLSARCGMPGRLDDEEAILNSRNGR